MSARTCLDDLENREQTPLVGNRTARCTRSLSGATRWSLVKGVCSVLDTCIWKIISSDASTQRSASGWRTPKRRILGNICEQHEHTSILGRQRNLVLADTSAILNNVFRNFCRLMPENRKQPSTYSVQIPGSTFYVNVSLPNFLPWSYSVTVRVM